jgi:hypothetical protein
MNFMVNWIVCPYQYNIPIFIDYYFSIDILDQKL